MITGRIRLKGADALRAAFADLDAKVAKSIARKALRAGAKVTRKETQNSVSVRSGAWKRNIKVRAMTRMRKGTVGVKVTVGRGAFKGDQFYASFVEFGFTHAPTVYNSKTGRFVAIGDKFHPGGKKIPGKHQMEQAFDRTKRRAADTVVGTALDLINRAATAAPKG